MGNLKTHTVDHYIKNYLYNILISPIWYLQNIFTKLILDIKNAYNLLKLSDLRTVSQIVEVWGAKTLRISVKNY